MKILYVLPHCSTGGMPQYLLKLIEETIKEHHVEVVEVNNVSDDYVVQRDKIKELVLFHQLFGNQQDLLELIQSFDVIHFQEIPETFIDIQVLNKLYRKGRKYDIVVTTHSSYTDPAAIRWTADRFVLVSEWSKKRFEQVFPGICEIWEYPVETINYNKESAKQQLGWNTEYKHVLHVGLFTPGKNQKELIEIAKLCTSEKILFHFVGNQAPNFEDYWGPLMKDLPSNCIIHGEVNNPEDYYKASDLFYFPSLFELNPLAVKEALSYSLPVILRKLDTYESMYDNKVQYIADNILSNRRVLLNKLGIYPRIQIIHLLTDSDDQRQHKSIEQLSKLSEYGFVYTQHVNKIYDGVPPSDFCRRPQHINQNPEHIQNGYGYLTGRHYGCFLAHVNAIRSIDENQFDYTLIFEADAYIKGDISDFVNIILEACNISEKENIQYISFGNNPSPSKLKYNNDFSETAIQQDLTHSYLLPSRYKTWYINAIETVPWDGSDIWFNEVFYRNGGKRFTTNKELCIQLPGISLIDSVVKWTIEKIHYDYIKIGTSDFDTFVEIYPENAKGLSIEPIKTYLDRLPNKLGNTKVNVAITDKDCNLSVFYVKPEDIESNNLPEWIKGCNSVGAPHPSVIRELSERGLMSLYTEDTIKGLSFLSLVSEFNIGSVDYLKVDTEGHDFVILRSMLETSIKPNKIRFEANSLYSEDAILNITKEMIDYGYKLVQRTANDIIMRLEAKEDNLAYTAPTLIISSGRRWHYLKKTLELLVDKNPDIAQIVKKVWVLDDRSSLGDRVNMDVKLTEIFGSKWNMVSFNSEQPFDFIDKFRMISKLIEPDDVVFLLEDDWECHDYLNLPYHINRLQNSDWTQIAFADPLEIQDAKIQNLTRIDGMYWKNPWPNSFKHPIKWDGDMCWWSLGVINNYTNNPSLIKGEVFYRAEYIKHKNFEASFADRIGGNQVFTQEALFRHFGEDSLINQL